MFRDGIIIAIVIYSIIFLICLLYEIFTNDLQNGSDPWFAQDKWFHLVACWGIVVISVIILDYIFKRQWKAYIPSLAATGAWCIGIAKELYDIPRESMRDMLADIVGILFGLTTVQLIWLYSKSDIRYQEYDNIEIV